MPTSSRIKSLLATWLGEEQDAITPAARAAADDEKLQVYDDDSRKNQRNSLGEGVQKNKETKKNKQQTSDSRYSIKKSPLRVR